MPKPWCYALVVLAGHPWILVALWGSGISTLVGVVASRDARWAGLFFLDLGEYPMHLWRSSACHWPNTAAPAVFQPVVLVVVTG